KSRRHSACRVQQQRPFRRLSHYKLKRAGRNASRLISITLLVSKTVLATAVRALPGNSIAGHSPEIFFHAVLAYGKSAPASPAERSCPVAAVAIDFFGFITLLPVY
ncbi:MAG: hypothetical protein ABIJ57_11330, partial [Pseudomonadota bacterium]